MASQSEMIDIESRTVNQWITRNVSLYNDREVLTLLDSDSHPCCYRYGEIVTRAKSWGGYYQRQGLNDGDRVIVILEHGIDLYCAYLGAVLGGFVPAMFSHPSVKHRKEIYFQTVFDLIDNADAKLMVCQGDWADELKQQLHERSADVLVLKLEAVAGEVESYDSCEFTVVDSQKIAFLQYSSGTTGLKKGVAISHDALLWQIRHYSSAIDLQEDDVIVSWLPLYHDMGLIACYWLALLTGTRLVAMSPFDWVANPGRLLQAMSDHGGTLCWQPNFAYEHLAKSVSDEQLQGIELSKVRGFINCSESLLPESHARFMERFSGCGVNQDMLWSCYAMAEHVFAVSSGVAVIDNNNERVAVSSGQVIEGVDTRVVDDDGEDVAIGETGEIMVKSPCLMREYWGNYQQTQKVMREGWYATGDLGYMKDHQLYVLGRKDDLIIVAGKNIYPQDIEGIVNEVPGVVAGRCVALGVNDGRMGTQRLVVLAESEEEDNAIRQEISKSISQAIDAETMVVAGDVRIVDRGWLQKSTSGKIARKENRLRYEAMIADEQVTEKTAASSSWVGISDSELHERLLELLSYAAEVDVEVVKGYVDKGRSFIEGGLLDSLKMVKLVVAIEDGFELMPGRVTGFNVDQLASMQGLIGCVRRYLHEEANGDSPGDGRLNPALSVRDRKSIDFMATDRECDLLILGSSRVQSLSTKVAGEYGYKAYNFSVFSARAEDWYCAYRHVIEHNRVPLKRVLLGVDIEAFTVGTGIDERLVASEHLWKYLDESDQAEIVRLREEQIKQVARQERGVRVLQELRNQTPDRVRKFEFARGTGDFVYCDDDQVSRRYNNRQPVVLDDVHGYDHEYEMRMVSFGQLNPKRLGYFVNLIRECMSRGTRVSCFLTPLHSRLHQHMIRKTVYLERIGQFVDGVKGNQSPLFDLHGFLTPEHFGGLDDDFTNAAHIGAANADILLRKLLEA